LADTDIDDGSKGLVGKVELVAVDRLGGREECAVLTPALAGVAFEALE
jgi:hypothetical protein